MKPHIRIISSILLVICLTTRSFALPTELIITQLSPKNNRETIEFEKFYDLPNVNTEFKAFMCYEMITDKSSNQYALQQLAYTDEYGFRRIDDYYLIAIGTFYADNCGKVFTVELDTGIIFEVIIGDIKDNRHTNSTNQYAKGGNVIEFIVDCELISNDCWLTGDMSCSGFEGEILSIMEVIKIEG